MTAPNDAPEQPRAEPPPEPPPLELEHARVRRHLRLVPRGLAYCRPVTS